MLKGALSRRRRRRRALQWAVVTTSALAALSVFIWYERLPMIVAPPDASIASRERAVPESNRPDLPEGRASRIEVFHNEPGIVERYTVQAVPRREVWITDEELMALLQAAGRRAGLIRTGTRLILEEDIVAADSKGAPPEGLPRG